MQKKIFHFLEEIEKAKKILEIQGIKRAKEIIEKFGGYYETKIE